MKKIRYDGIFCEWSCEELDSNDTGAIHFKFCKCKKYKCILSNTLWSRSKSKVKEKCDFIKDDRFKDKLYRSSECIDENHD